MRIAVVIESIETWRGGAETSTMELSRLLTRRGHDVHVITASRSPSPPNLTIHTVSPTAVIRPLRTAAFIRKATGFLKEHPFDIVHAVVPLPCADVYQPRGGLLKETIERNIALRPTASRRLVKRLLTGISVKYQSLLDLEAQTLRPDGPLILAVSKYVARQCEKHYGLPASRTRVVFNGVDPPRATPEQQAADRQAIRAQYHVPDGTLLLLFIAHNLRLKGFAPLLRTARTLVQRGFDDFRLLVIGRDNPVRFQRQINQLKLNSHVTFTGPTKRIAAFYHAADVCVHPTYYDPCSRVVLEALTRGLPCITTAFNGAAEMIEDGKNGFVVASPDDVPAWADRIAALRSPELRGEMSRNAVRLRDQISMERHVAELDAVYAEIV